MNHYFGVITRYGMSILLLSILLSYSSCCSQKHATVSQTVDYSGPPTIIYKTRADYSKLVPVTLSADRSQIVSYPAPTDINYKGNLAYPTPLAKGFLLDNRGITDNTVFLNITYDEYSKLERAPALEAMIMLIKDKDPIIEMYDLGTRNAYKNEIEDINSIIRKGMLTKFKRIK